MSNDLEKAAKKRLEARLDDMGKFIKALSGDYKFSRQVLEKDSKNQMFRRLVVRNFCALFEGQIHSMKWLILTFYKGLKMEITEAEIAVLREETYDLDNNGQAKSKTQFFSYKKNFTFGCRLFARVFHCSRVVDFRSEGWNCVIKVFDVRNRLMHPNQSKGVEVSDAEVEVVKKANDWLREVGGDVFASWDLNKVFETAKLRKSSELN